MAGNEDRDGYRLVRDASDKYRRTGNRLMMARKRLAIAEREHEVSARELKVAIRAVQPALLDEPVVAESELPGVQP